MRRPIAVLALGATVAGAARGGGADFPRHLTEGPNLPRDVPLDTYWLGPYSGSVGDASRWSPHVPGAFIGHFLNVHIREVGAPYEITGAGLYAWNLIVPSSGASVTTGFLSVKDTVDLERGTLRMRSSTNSYAMARRFHIGGVLIVEGRCAFSAWQQYSTAPDEFIVTGAMWCLGLDASIYDNLTRSWGAIQNEGEIVVAATGPGQYVTLQAPRIDNDGLLRIDGAFDNRERTVFGLAKNAGRIEAAGDGARIFCVDDGLTNHGDIIVEAGGSLELHASTLRHEGGLISTAGELALDCELIEWSGGGFDDNVLLSNIRLELIGDGPSGAVGLGPACILEGDIPEGVTISLGTMNTEDGPVHAEVVWPGGVNRGRIETNDSAHNQFVADGVIQNEGEIAAVQGWILAEIRGPGHVRLGVFSLVGQVGGANVFDGPVEVDPHARAQVNGATTLRGALRVRPTFAAILPNFQHQVAFTAPLTIEGGALEIDPGPGFAPAWGRVYNLVGAPSVVGDFASVSAAPLPDPLWRWEIERYGASYRGRIAHLADVNRDLGIDFQDINAVVSAFGQAGGSEDVNGDGVVNFADLIIVAEHFGQYAG